MPHGGPDWGTIGPLGTVYTVEDLGELAVRLGSPVSFDRRGNIVLIDNFDGGLSKIGDSEVSGALAALDISNKRSYHGPFSCRMVAHPNAATSITYYIPYPILGRMGFEFAWLREGEDLEWISLHVRLLDGSDSWDARVYWWAEHKTWYVYDDDLGDWRALSPTVDYDIACPTFNHTKLIIDYVTRKYVELVVNNITYDLSGINLETFEDDENAKIWLTIENEADEPDPSTVYLDHVIVTQNEP